jgi:ferritin-like protein
MCQYLLACFSLKQSVEEGLTAEQLAAINRWRTVLQGIAVQEMLHLALVANLMSAREAAWLLVQERVRLLADRCTGLATTDGMPEVVGAARSLDRLLERLAAHVAPGMC